MKITPIDIHNKEFSRSIRGYNPDEVDEFLDEIIEAFENLYKENLDMQDRIENLEIKAKSYKAMESTLQETLVTAQKTAEDVVKTGKEKADLIIEQAKNRAQGLIEDANNQVIKINNEYQNVEKQVQVFKNQFRTFLKTQLEMLDASDPITNIKEK
ncbi:MAG: DivIVA domain-containing protein [Clostridiales bacterium]|nr:DivIVA domain-containing protein [Clostridiales bacterium]